MGGLEALAALAGDWTAIYELRGDPSFECDTPSTAAVRPVVGGRFVRIDYTWDEDDRLEERGPQEGSLLVGFEPDPAPGSATVVMIDSWHLHDAVMVSRGPRQDDGGVDVFGTWSAGDNAPDWGWRTILAPASDGWSMTMFVVTPDGVESPAVHALYRRSE
jgi:hypothetical protein